MLIKTENLSYEEIIKKLTKETGTYQSYFKIDTIRLDRALEETKTSHTWEIAIINQQPMFRSIGCTRIGPWFTLDYFLQHFTNKQTLFNSVFKLVPADSGPSCRDFHRYPEYPIVPDKKQSLWSKLFGNKPL